MKCWICVMLAALLGVASAQEGKGRFDLDWIYIHEMGEWVWQGRLLGFLGGVDISLLDEDGETETLRLKAQTWDFQYEGQGPEEITSIRLVGDVVVESPEDAHIAAGLAVWNQAAGVITFTENPVLTMKGGTHMPADRIVLDLATEEFRAFGLRNLRVRTEDFFGAKKEDPSLLRVEDVRDWPALLAKVQGQAKAGGPSPGKRLVELLDEAGRASFLGLDATQGTEKGVQSEVAKGFNKVLKGADFYEAASWEGVNIGAEATVLLARDVKKLKPAEVLRLNRLLLTAAYRELVLPPRPPVKAAEKEPAA